MYAVMYNKKVRKGVRNERYFEPTDVTDEEHDAPVDRSPKGAPRRDDPLDHTRSADQRMSNEDALTEQEDARSAEE